MAVFPLQKKHYPTVPPPQSESSLPMNSGIRDPQTDGITALFAELGVVLVHFIGESTGVGSEVTDNLSPIEAAKRVLDTQCEVSCSTVTKGDCRAWNNYFGTIGLILDPIIRRNITHSTITDGGTKAPVRGTTERTGTNGLNSDADLKFAVNRRPIGHHNEICAKGYQVIGIFHEGAKAVPIQFNRKGGNQVSYTYMNFLQALGNLPLYAWNSSRFLRLEFSSDTDDIKISTATPVEISKVYT